MSSSGVGPEQDPWGQYHRIEEIERIRRKEEPGGKGQEPSGRPPGDGKGWVTFLLLLLDKVLEFVKRAIRKHLAAQSTEKIRESLLLIKTSFEIMMRDDKSQDISFLNTLSKLWQTILEYSVQLEPSGFEAKKLKTLIKDIESCPKLGEHTFGYYLDEYAGQRWLPIPYMELIEELHRQHAQDPSSSLLTRWVGMLEEILNSE